MTRSIEFTEDITDVIVEILEGKHGAAPGIIIETGPYKGQGSMKMLALAQKVANLGSRRESIAHYSLEAVWEFVLDARVAALKYPWIQVIHALPCGLEESRKFVREDTWRDEHPEIPHDYPDPATGYLWELSDEHLGMQYHIPEQAWFSKHLPLYRDKVPLFFLDSGGGTGFLEFQTMVALMGDTEYYVILDDCDHVKHWRSFEELGKIVWAYIKQDPEFDSLRQHPRWIAARHVKK